MLKMTLKTMIFFYSNQFIGNWSLQESHGWTVGQWVYHRELKKDMVKSIPGQGQNKAQTLTASTWSFERAQI